MSEARDDAPAGGSAGAILRQARQAQGMHIAVLAAAIKVSPRKLEALEADRFDELPDATFTRALAQTVCRTLKIDPAPVLALLPPPPGQRLEQVGEGLNAPFRERPGQAPAREWADVISPAVWVPAAMLLLALAIYFLPPGLVSLPGLGSGASAPASRAASAGTTTTTAIATPAAEPASAAPAASTVVEAVTPAVAAAPAAAEAASAAVPAAAPAAPAAPASAVGVLQLKASAESWVEVLDARGQPLLSRLLQPGEMVGLDGAVPLKVTIGNARATEVSFRGRSVDLSGRVRDNVARLDLK